MREAGQRLPEGAFQTHGTALKKKKKASTWESPSTFLASAVPNCFTLSPEPCC